MDQSHWATRDLSERICVTGSGDHVDCSQEGSLTRLAGERCLFTKKELAAM